MTWPGLPVLGNNQISSFEKSRILGGLLEQLPVTPNAAIYWILILGCSIRKAHVKFSGQVCYLFQSCLKIQRSVLLGCVLAAQVLQKINKLIQVCHMIELYPVGMDSDQLVYVFLSFFGRGYSSKTFPSCSRTHLLAKLHTLHCYRSGGYLIPFFYHISSFFSQAIKLAYLYEQENLPNV